MTTHIAAALAAALLLAACGIGAPGGATLDGTWRLTAGARDGAPLPILADAPITMTITGAEIGGTAACNHYGGEVTIEGDALRVGSLAVTEMGCDAGAMESEAAYLAAIGDVTSFSRSGDRLTLSGDGVELAYAFVPPPADASLVGPVWVLDSLVEGDAVSSVAGEPATLVLHEDGTLSGTTGCRTFDGRYTMADDGISVSELVNDDRACPEIADQDEHVLRVIGGGFAYAVDGDLLTLTDGDEGLIYRASTDR